LNFLLSLLRRAAIDRNGHSAIALSGERDHLLEVIELLELLLHAVEHLILHLLCRGAGPHHQRRHRRHREVRILELPELREAEHAGEGNDGKKELHDGPVIQGPL
jgi:hypothetical protein